MVKCRIVIVDDHRLFREGIAEICDSEPDLEIVGQADNGTTALEIIRKASPDIVLLDIAMPGTGVQDLLPQVFDLVSPPQVAIVSMYDDPRLVRKLMSLGAHAYISKGAARHELLTAIRSIADNRNHVMLSISRETMERLNESSSGLLTTRELEVLKLVSAGFRNSEIATQLYISEGTVKRHLTNIYIKLEVPSRINAVNKAAELGLLKAERG
jgi:DNA-binding NarL/FixJ family response regulator